MGKNVPFGLLTLVLWFGLPGGSVRGQSLQLEARSLSRGDLPVGFPVELLEAGFAVIELAVGNTGDASLPIGADAIQVFSPRKKRLEQVPTGKILPKLAKFYRGGGAAGREVYAGGPQVTPPSAPPPRSGSGGDGYAALMTEQLRVVLEGYRLKQGSLAPGESIQGFVYVKSKHQGSELAAGEVVLGAARAVIE